MAPQSSTADRAARNVSIFRRRFRPRHAVASLAVLGAMSSFVLLSSSGAQTTASCDGTLQASLSSDGRIYSYPTDKWRTEVTAALPSPIGPGTYDVNGASWDGYAARVGITQPLEGWFAEFRAADGTVLATTAATPDLADLVEQAEWQGALGTVSWDSGEATTVRAVHRYLGTDQSPNSVLPVCVGLSPTSSGDSSTPGDPPAGGSSENEDGPPSTDDPGITTEVEGIIELPPTVVAQPVDADPSFTG